MKLLLLLFFLTFPIYSYTIISKDLKVIYANITSQDGKFVNIATGSETKRLRKDTIAKIIIQDVKDPETLKKFLKKVKDLHPGYTAPSEAEPPQTAKFEDLEFESAKILVEEIEKEEKEKELKELSRKALTRSFIFPGYGLYTLESKKTGYMYGFLFTSSVIGSIYSHYNSKNDLEKYKQKVDFDTKIVYTIYNPYLQEDASIKYFLFSKIQQKSLYNSYEGNVRQGNNLLGVALGIYLIQIAHTYFNINYSFVEKEATVNVKVGFSIFPEINKNYIQANSSTGGNLFIQFVW